MKTAFIGTGLMGGPMAERLVGAGHAVVVFNRSRNKAEALTVKGVKVADTAAEAVRSADCVFLMLGDEPAIRSVLFESATRESLSRRTVIQMGTIGPDQSRGLMADIQAAGGQYLEAPVLGSIPEAKAGSLIVMVGGTQAQFDAHRSLLAVFGPEPRLIGPVGQAAGIKLALNQLIASLTTAFSLSLGFVQRQGADVGQFMEILRESALYAPTFDKKLPRMRAHDYINPNFPTKHLAKDVDLFLEESSSLGLDTALLEGVRHSIERALHRGLAEADYSAVFEGVVRLEA